LELVIRVKPHPRFSRRGDDVLSDVSIDFVLAALGGEVTVDTLHGPAKLHVDPGTQPDRVLELRGKGIPHRFRSGAGDHRCRVRVVIPLAMSPEAKRLVEEFDRELTETERRSVWGRLASLFSG
jgi:molecular chaperone DnaJ